jgi:pimeloyl-ACP methyl ester carboxylesterase
MGGLFMPMRYSGRLIVVLNVLAHNPRRRETEGAMSGTSSIVRLALAAALILAAALLAFGGDQMNAPIQRRTCRSADGIEIVYSVVGTGEPALVFIHGGLADRSFWDAELKAFGSRYKTIALDLAGHGESGGDRKVWGMPQFGQDVKAVVDAEKPAKVILFGNSLGGPVAVEAALLLPGRVLGVVGVDTFQAIPDVLPADQMKERADQFDQDFAGSVKMMVGMLFHKDADPAIVADAEKRMARTSPRTAKSMFLGMAGYDEAASVRKLKVPLRAINGDLYPTDIAADRRVYPDFDAVIMTHMGHYPMLERPDEFNKLVAQVVDELTKPVPKR